jgi:competence protein ComEA
MKTKWQFQHLALQQELEDCANQPTAIQPVVTAPIWQRTAFPSSFPNTPLPGQEISLADELELTEQDTTLLVAIPPIQPLISRKKRVLRIIGLSICLLLVLLLIFVWHASLSSPTDQTQTITQQSFTSATTTPTTDATAANTDNTGAIQVYILGAVKHPGVYILPAGARVYQLVQAAGGTTSEANMVALNLAAKLTDGEEIYVLTIGETPPANVNSSSISTNTITTTPIVTSGQLVNINTATESQMEQTLHVSSTTATKIITYRTQHGPYTAVSQLLQAISQSIYDRIKNMVTL